VGFLTCPHRAAGARSRSLHAFLIIGNLELLTLHSQVVRRVRVRKFPEKVMVDQELVLEIVEVLEGSTSLPDWLVD
jgi:hypothetical protein